MKRVEAGKIKARLFGQVFKKFTPLSRRYYLPSCPVDRLFELLFAQFGNVVAKRRERGAFLCGIRFLFRHAASFFQRPPRGESARRPLLFNSLSDEDSVSKGVGCQRGFAVAGINTKAGSKLPAL